MQMTMTLKNDFYELTATESSDSLPVYHIRLHPDNMIFKAHFPGEPVTPGVCLIQMGMELAEEYLQKKLRLRLLKNVKFLSVVSPLQTPTFSFRITKLTADPENSQYSLQMAADAEGTPLLKMSMICTVLQALE